MTTLTCNRTLDAPARLLFYFRPRPAGSNIVGVVPCVTCYGTGRQLSDCAVKVFCPECEGRGTLPARPIVNHSLSFNI